ncbi:hypothetical protein DY000_02024870 [Brassica cretica]|uniref:Drought induced 19 protein type zinc-binding domain-containing protein n=1 Tax=Brassica cretica TaxID=69181 RepID=A0ABQ7EKE0_BRACR|nr:hypothetical protein DY000_02024870 [Brassica cretica]
MSFRFTGVYKEEAGKAKEEAPSPKKKKTLPCPFCHVLFLTTESFPEMVNGKPFIRFAPPPPPQATSCASTSDTTATGNPYSRFEDLNSTHEAHRLFSRS